MCGKCVWVESIRGGRIRAEPQMRRSLAPRRVLKKDGMDHKEQGGQGTSAGAGPLEPLHLFVVVVLVFFILHAKSRGKPWVDFKQELWG